MPLSDELRKRGGEFMTPFPTYESGFQAYLIFRSQIEAAITEERNVWRNKFSPNINLLESSVALKIITGEWNSTSDDTRTRSVNLSIPKKDAKSNTLKLRQVDIKDRGEWVHDSLELTFQTSFNYLRFALNFSPYEQFGYKYWDDVESEPDIPVGEKELKLEKNIALPTTPFLDVDFQNASPSIQKRIYELNPHGHEKIQDLETAGVLFEFGLQKAIKFVQNRNVVVEK